MKKLAAIFFIGLFLFNIIGYRLVFYFAQKQEDARVEASLDNSDYNENDLVTIKVPLSLPYQTNWKDFERVDGEVTLDGKIYKYVKRKVEDGQLILLCLPDEHKMRLQTARDDFFKMANDLNATSSSKKSGNSISIKNVLSDYDKYYADYSNLFISSRAAYETPINISAKTIPFHDCPEQPPC
ncbi:MAG TPA: hypothetical protein VG738_01535 [Chitinophagaceae bacterium]|nr:hypothetical protein [Chitinophagaceae bacterium]